MLDMDCITYYTSPMTRAKEEDTKITSMRLPIRLVKKLNRAAKARGVTFNRLLWQIIEEFLASHGLLKDKDRKRPPVDKGE